MRGQPTEAELVRRATQLGRDTKRTRSADEIALLCARIDEARAGRPIGSLRLLTTAQLDAYAAALREIDPDELARDIPPFPLDAQISG